MPAVPTGSDRPPTPRMTRLHRLLAPLGAAAVVMTAALGASADIYQYVDPQGVIHFTNVKNDPRYRVYIRGDRALRANGYAGTPTSYGVPPSERDPARFTRFDEWIHDAATLYQIP
jgi:hypothetical protein